MADCVSLLQSSQRVPKTRLENLPTMAKTFFRSHKRLAHVRELLAAQVFQLPAFEQIPDALLWIQLRCIPRKTFQMEPLGCPSGEKLFDEVGTVDRRAIPNDRQFPADLAQQHP